MKRFVVECKGQSLLKECAFSASPLFRMKGLLGHSELSEDEGIWLKPCAQIHMFFMRFSIDAIFLDRSNEILHIEHSIAPWRVSRWVRKAHSVVECSAGKSERYGLETGDKLVFSDTTDSG